MVVMGFASCADELDISSIDPQSSATYDETALLAKQYATLGLTGQTGPDGNGDISGDEGETGFYRVTFNLMELCTDECIWAWQTDEDIPAITNISWTSSSTRTYWAYQRLAYNITLYNSYLAEGCGDETSQAEVRFLRALHYWYFLDLFHKAPFKTGFSVTDLPEELAGVDLYNWLDEELTEIEPQMAEIGAYCNSTNFGRADRGAAYALHARLALNCDVYTDGTVNDYQKAVDYCTKVIESGAYALSTIAKESVHTSTTTGNCSVVGEQTTTINNSGYAQLFMGDNDQNADAMKEIIFPIRQDGVKTQEYSGSTYLVSSMIISGMPFCNTDNYWSCNFARKDLVMKFFNDESAIPMASGTYSYSTEGDVIFKDDSLGTTTAKMIEAANDDRALFYAGIGGGIRTLEPGKNITGFTNGLSIVKWTNRNLSEVSGNDATFQDTDIPLIRYAEIYMTRAEAYYRLGENSFALADLKVITDRAHATEHTSVTDDVLIDEWCKEFYMEGRRRSDLNRFGLFAGSKYIWDYKGGVSGGTGVDSHYQYYPIPDNDLAGNPNMTQNPGY